MRAQPCFGDLPGRFSWVLLQASFGTAKGLKSFSHSIISYGLQEYHNIFDKGYGSIELKSGALYISVRFL